ncbi:MAG TPA: PIN domain-containing protein [Opitutaceae bacterium]
MDTCVWSQALRRGAPAGGEVVRELTRLVSQGAVEIAGPIRQEILSGVRTEAQFKQLEEVLKSFADIPIGPEDYVEAARFYNRCRARGVQGSGTDLLLCAIAVRECLPIYTVDQDFERYAAILPITLHRAQSAAS